MFTRTGKYVRGPLEALKAVAGRTTTQFRRCGQPMQPDNLPPIDGRYWLAILLASVLGTVGGDFVSQSLGLGYIYGLPAMAALFLTSLYAEKVSTRFGEAFYWTAVVVTRMAATNLADLATHQLGIGYEPVAHVLTTALLLVVLWPRRSAAAENTLSTLPAVDTRYWLGILTASVLGTAMGDFCEELLSGSAQACLLLLPLFAVALLIKRKAKLGAELFYWITLVVARTAGTAIGDYLAGDDGLNFGTGLVAVATAITLAGLLLLYRQGKFLTLAQVRAFFAPRQTVAREGDDRFWVFATLAVAATQMLIQWGYTAMGAAQATSISDTLKPYIGFEIGSSRLYDSWLLPFLLVPLLVVLLVGKLTRLWKEIVYWLALFLTAGVASSVALFSLYAGGFGQPAYVIVAVLAPVLLAITWFTHRRPPYRFASALASKDVSLVHFGLLFIAIVIGVAVGNNLGTFLNQGYYVSTLVSLVPLLLVLRLRKRVAATSTYMQESISWLACVLAAVFGFPLGCSVQYILATNVGLAAMPAQGWTPIVVGTVLAALIWWWRPGVPWQNIVAAFYARVCAVVRLTILYRRALIGLTVVVIGIGTHFFADLVVMPMRPAQEVLYNQGMLSLHNDLEKQKQWSGFVHPEMDLFQRSLQYFEHQREAGLLDRLLYGEPDTVLASQANLKIGVILLYNAKDDTKLLNEAKGYLELAVQLNPGVPYAQDLLNHVGGSAADINRLALMALAGERDLEMLYEKNPQYRSKKPNKSKDGAGEEGKEGGDQKGEPDQASDDPGKQSNQKPDQPGEASKNDTLQQNMQDVNGGKGNDGI